MISSARFEFEPRNGSSVIDIYCKPIADNRGSFSRLFCVNDYREVAKGFSVRQINFSRTTKAGTVRGLHYQDKPKSEDKIVFCLSGSVWDVVVNVEETNQDYLNWSATVLDSKDGNGIFIPKGYAHGFQSLEPDTTLIYFHSEDYVPKHQKGINPTDNRLSIGWPLKVTEISDKDRNWAALK